MRSLENEESGKSAGYFYHASRPFLSNLSLLVLSSSSPCQRHIGITMTVCGKTFLF